MKEGTFAGTGESRLLTSLLLPCIDVKSFLDFSSLGAVAFTLCLLYPLQNLNAMATVRAK